MTLQVKKVQIPDFTTFEIIVYGDRPKWSRHGQWAFNVLCAERPDLSEQVRATDLDPFHRDERLRSFMEFVKANW